jgi:hypothetical protein
MLGRVRTHRKGGRLPGRLALVVARIQEARVANTEVNDIVVHLRHVHAGNLRRYLQQRILGPRQSLPDSPRCIAPCMSISSNVSPTNRCCWEQRV